MALPYKLRTFLWRFCKNNIPVRKLLRSKGVETTIMCPMCGTDIENLRHLFCECSYAVECWQISGLNIDFQEVELASSWLLEMISKESTETIQKMATVLSGIWFSRNRKVWEGKEISPAIAMELSAKQVQDWQEANMSKLPDNDVYHDQTRKDNVVWQAPDIGFCKLNVDASLFRGENMFSLGLIMRNDVGQFVMGKNLKVAGEVAVMEAEARGVYETIRRIEQMGFHHVVIESDSKLVVQALKSLESYQLEVGHILDECKENMKNRVDISICHVKKQANGAAHFMARVPCLLNSSNCFTSPPDLLEMLPSEFSK